MAIQIGGTTVISDSRKLENIVDCTGTFEDFHSNLVTIVDNINFTNPMMSLTMSGNVTFTESGITEGRTCTLLLDTSSNTHTPTFSSTINWPDNTEPTWGDYQHWMITFHAVSATEVRANAVGYTETTATPPTETISLSGTTSTPITFFDSAASNNNDLVMGWRFGSDGNIYKYESIYNVGGSGIYLYSSTQWNNITPSKTYWIRVTNFSGSQTLSTIDSDTLNSWITLSSNRDFRVRDSRDIESYAQENVVMKVEIAERVFGTEQHSTSSPTYYSATVGYLDGEGFPETIHNAYWNGTQVYSGGFSSSTSPGDIFLGTDGNYYRTGTLQQQVGNPTTYSYAIQQATFTILATGYYECEYSGTA